MRIVFTRSVGAGGHREWSLEIQHITCVDRARWAAEQEARLRMALEAIYFDSSEGEEIARRALEGEP